MREYSLVIVKIHFFLFFGEQDAFGEIEAKTYYSTMKVFYAPNRPTQYSICSIMLDTFPTPMILDVHRFPHLFGYQLLCSAGHSPISLSIFFSSLIFLDAFHALSSSILIILQDSTGCDNSPSPLIPTLLYDTVPLLTADLPLISD